jgi:type IV pilus assembly protein PilY1
LNLMVMGRDHKLYYEAYNDASDLNNDGTVDVGYKPATVTYFGVFDSFLCYNYTGSYFTPVSRTSTKRCSGAWSGDFLNYLTTSRIDALRKVLYGGKRSTDNLTQTIIERGYVSQDGHSWAKEYTSVAVDGYDLRQYAPLPLPKSGFRHLFGSVNLNSDPTTPRLRILTDSQFRVWNWASIEGPVLSDIDVRVLRRRCWLRSAPPRPATRPCSKRW